jgi:DNA-formamidopyrimidine glycosylase
MPEICECHLIANSLNTLCSGKILNKLQFDDKSKFYKHPIKNILNLPSLLTRVYAHGKKIIFELENNEYIISSLGMEGHWVLKPEKHSNLWLEFEDKTSETCSGCSTSKTIYFDDSRHFGLIEIALNKKELNEIMKKVGYCLLTQRDKITKDWWRLQFSNKRIKKPLCDFLLDQKRFSGIGNWIRAEVLYKAKLNPHRKIYDLNENEIENLRLSVFEIIDIGYKLGGLTIATYWDPTGKTGKYICQCYNRKKDNLGNEVIREKMGGGRMIHWVKEIQF